MNKATIGFIQQWLLKANEDLLVVERLVDYELIATSSACFHRLFQVIKTLKGLFAGT